MKEYWELFYSFAKIGAFTFGGGYAMLPLIQREVVEKALGNRRRDYGLLCRRTMYTRYHCRKYRYLYRLLQKALSAVSLQLWV